jgi:hypothetical protein
LLARKLTTNNQLFRPTAIGRIWFSIQLLFTGSGPADERGPALEAVVQRSGPGRSVWHFAPLKRHPHMQGIVYEEACLLSQRQALLRRQILQKNCCKTTIAFCRESRRKGDAPALDHVGMGLASCHFG